MWNVYKILAITYFIIAVLSIVFINQEYYWDINIAIGNLN